MRWKSEGLAPHLLKTFFNPFLPQNIFLLARSFLECNGNLRGVVAEPLPTFLALRRRRSTASQLKFRARRRSNNEARRPLRVLPKPRKLPVDRSSDRKWPDRMLSQNLQQSVRSRIHLKDKFVFDLDINGVS